METNTYIYNFSIELQIISADIFDYLNSSKDLALKEKNINESIQNFANSAAILNLYNGCETKEEASERFLGAHSWVLHENKIIMENIDTIESNNPDKEEKSQNAFYWGLSLEQIPFQRCLDFCSLINVGINAGELRSLIALNNQD